ncbi:MAG TPA: LysM domain-containing protein [Pseudonocardiaceae bacterium]|jgi:hypothetical protein|nr:LysM domain-containing protein [Pseudonocardiaceae bacterium]
MAVATNIGFNLSPRAATGTAGHGRRLATPRRRPPIGDGRRPARLVAAPHRATARPCGPRPIAGSIGWLVLLAGLAFVVVLGIGWSTGGQDTSSVPNRTEVVQVHRGDTLWTVAERMAPAAAPIAVVDRIRQLNGLDADSVLYPGELLQVPSNLSAGAAAKVGAIQR